MILYYIKCLMFTKNNNIIINTKQVEKIIFILVVMMTVLKSLRLSMKKKIVIY